MDVLGIILIITGTLEIVLSLFIFLRNRHSQINLSFAFLNFSLGSWTLAITFFMISNDPQIAFLWAKGIYISGALIASSLLYFANVFPKANNLSARKKLFIIIPTIVHTVLLALPEYLTHEIVSHSWGKEVVLGNVEYLIYSIYFLSFFYAAIFILWQKYKATSGFLHRQILFIMISMFIASIAGVIFDLILPWLKVYRYIYFGPPFTMIIFWFTVYSIFKHKLLDIRFILARSVAYTMLVIWVGCIYALALYWITKKIFLGSIISYQLIINAVLAILIGFTFQPIRTLLEKATDKIFFKGKYKSAELILELTKIMASNFSLNHVTQKTLDKLIDTLRITKGAFILYKNDKDMTIIEKNYSYDLNTKKEQIYNLYKLQRILIYDEEENADVKKLMHEIGIAVALPMIKEKDQEEGLLFLGEKKSGEMYSGQDISILKIFGPEVSVAIQNAKSNEEIMKFNVTLKEEVDKATKDLREANERLKELDRLKDDFVSLASHELRTPMTAIKSYLWMVLEGQGGALNDKQKHYVQRSYNSVERLIRLVNDMLNISRIDSGRLTIQIESSDIEKMIKEVVEDIKPRADELGIDIIFIQLNNAPRVLADPDKIKEVIYNLIGNSLKFTPIGGIINISCIQKDNSIEVSIADTGAGIATEDLPKIFQKFGIIPGTYLANQSTSGTGLGLYICRSLVELHGGKIWASSEGKSHGTTFTFSLKIFNQDDFNFFQEKFKQTAKINTSLIHEQIE